MIASNLFGQTIQQVKHNHAQLSKSPSTHNNIIKDALFNYTCNDFELSLNTLVFFQLY